MQALRHTDCPFGQALVLDPWVEPVPVSGIDVVPVSKPLYTINSEDFTQWKSHMDDVTTISRESRSSTAAKAGLSRSVLRVPRNRTQVDLLQRRYDPRHGW